MSIRPNIYLQTQQIIKNSSILQGTLSALKFRYPLKYLGAKYSEILMPCIPGIQHEVKENNTKEEQEKCFIKVPFETETKVIASGKRSAIFINNNKMLRYKGCGNELKGFNIENN